VALDPLAAAADLNVRGLLVDEAETAAVAAFLSSVSAAIRDAAGTPISETTSTLTLEGGAGQWLTLPGLPITAVSSVLLDDVAVTDWRLRTQRLWRAAGWQSGYGPSEVTVTQTHGLPDVPADIVDLVCRFTAAALTAFRAGDGGASLATGIITSERIGDYAVTYGGMGLVTEVELPDYLRERLAARFGGGISSMRSR
jgi:hypothetical protein